MFTVEVNDGRYDLLFTFAQANGFAACRINYGHKAVRCAEVNAYHLVRSPDGAVLDIDLNTCQ